LRPFRCCFAIVLPTVGYQLVAAFGPGQRGMEGPSVLHCEAMT
jgi:hypothetical protein